MGQQHRGLLQGFIFTAPFTQGLNLIHDTYETGVAY